MYFVVKTKALISGVVAVQLICVFGFASAKKLISHDAAQMYLVHLK